MRKNNHRKITMTLIQTLRPKWIALRTGQQGAHSVEVGALTSVRKISYRTQTKLKMFSIATFNVRTLNKINQPPMKIRSL